ncbi:MAG: hypothetical protein CK531_04160 [Gemmatimonadetes bacterium]|nr:MAG: hypothetical protein CK531_04160 [Gemmatimonadota bacterium]
MINETRERFLRSILEQIPAERITEVHFFPAIRQGQVETGVAVVAMIPPVVAPVADALGEEPVPELALESSTHAGETVGEPAELPAELPVELLVERTVVHTAAYRWTRKGPERGKWVVDIVAEADAPLAAVEAVVRGVQERAGEALDAHRMTGAEVQAMLAAAPAVLPA